MYRMYLCMQEKPKTVSQEKRFTSGSEDGMHSNENVHGKLAAAKVSKPLNHAGVKSDVTFCIGT